MPDVKWGTGLGLGLVAAVSGGILWGVLAAFTGYIFALLSIVLGTLVAAAVRRGAGRVTHSVVAMSGALTLFSIFLGDVVGLTLVANAQGISVGVLDVILAYPQILALSPGEAALTYGFGILGIGAGAGWLLRQMPRKMEETFPSPTPAATDNVPSEAQAVHILERTRTRVATRVVLPSPRNQFIDATFEALTGMASVRVGETLFRRERVWGRQKIIEVPTEGTTPSVVAFRFFGVTTPKIEVRIDGKPVLTA